ncbi:MAG: hypothetical protein OEW15_17465 [Nitrospirota bacterium]|nr:hypothetical protein [Nitrospirota bacterium]
MRKMNCWEFHKCGRELGGHNRAQGVCPTAVQTALNGVHGGLHGGRSCWIVSGTLCDGEQQGSFGDKFQRCGQCKFYRLVMQEEGAQFNLSAVLLGKLKAGLKRRTADARGPENGAL